MKFRSDFINVLLIYYIIYCYRNPTLYLCGHGYGSRSWLELAFRRYDYC